MKKLVFGLLATALMSIGATGQTLSDAGKKSVINAQMVTLVNVSKAFYTKGQSYDDFVKALTIPSPTVPSQDELFRKVYSYVSGNTSDCDIMKADNSVLSRFALDLTQSPKNMSTPNATYSERKKWWQILINSVINIAVDVYITTQHEPIDLWPDA